jgi:threonine synthase
MLPLETGTEAASLGEGWTPLLTLEDAGRQLWVKLEFLAPTGSFKDRGTSVLISALRTQGVRQVVEDSSGNAAASLAAYAARAGIEAQICVPAHASPGKLRQIEAYGARLVKVEGSRERASERAQQLASEGQCYYASHVYSPFVLEGQKTFAYEVWEQLNGQLPEWLIYPTGNGTLLYGSYLGLCDLKDAGVIDRLPRLIAVQAENCAPLFAPFQGHLPTGPTAEGRRSTIAEGIAVRRPARAEQVLKALHETGGEVVAVSEDEIRDAQRALARQGLYVEPTAAVALAGWRHLKDRIKPRDQVLLPLTGSGLKSPS